MRRVRHVLILVFRKLVPLHLGIIGKSGIICYRFCRCMRTIESAPYHIYRKHRMCYKGGFENEI
jgi:hypothetical protein